MKLTIGFSPCPNDTFIFDSLVNKKIEESGLEFEVFIEDVQTLNEWALQGKLDITKISYGVLPLVLNEYMVLNAGSALGKGVGPLLIAKTQIPKLESQIQQLSVAIPGENTTANLLFSLAFPQATKKKFIPFTAIEDSVLQNRTDCGVIIHENRFTYEKRGLVKLIDLGEFWEQQTALPIPLGGIIIRKGYNFDLKNRINDLIRKSIEASFRQYPNFSAFVKMHANEMEEQIMRKHIDLYVNDFSLDLGIEGIKAINKLLEIYKKNTKTAEQFSGIFLHA